MTERVSFDGVNVVVKDMQAMVSFYERLGMTFRDGGEEWAPNHRSGVSDGSFDFDLDSSAFAHLWNEGWPEGKAGVVIGFHVESRSAVDEVYADLVGLGCRSQQAPYDAFWGARYAVVEDPDGNSVG